jgi:hypothetical protein
LRRVLSLGLRHRQAVDALIVLAVAATSRVTVLKGMALAFVDFCHVLMLAATVIEFKILMKRRH